MVKVQQLENKPTITEVVKIESQESIVLSRKAPTKSVKKEEKKGKSGHWSEEEKLKYIIFLQYHSNKFEIKELRRAWKIFKSMSEFIPSRSADQCRSHHQKMEKRYESYREIVDSHKIMIRPDIYESAYAFFSTNVLDKLQNTNIPYKSSYCRDEEKEKRREKEQGLSNIREKQFWRLQQALIGNCNNMITNNYLNKIQPNLNAHHQYPLVKIQEGRGQLDQYFQEREQLLMIKQNYPQEELLPPKQQAS